MKQPLAKQSGMTLIELTIATAILAVMLVAITQFFINLIHQDRAQVSVQNSTQNVRYALDDITATARSANQVYVISNPASPGPAAFNQICLYQDQSMVEYFVVTPGPMSGAHQILYKRIYNSIASIPNPPCPTISDWHQDSGSNVAVTSDSQAANGDTTGLNVVDFRAYKNTVAGIPTLTVRLGMTTNLTDLNPADIRSCEAGTTEYCSVTSFETTISLRGTQNTGP